MFHALKSLARIVWGASRRTKSFEFGLSFVMDAERSDWQSSLEKRASQVNKRGRRRRRKKKEEEEEEDGLKVKEDGAYRYCHLFGPTLARYT